MFSAFGPVRALKPSRRSWLSSHEDDRSRKQRSCEKVQKLIRRLAFSRWLGFSSAGVSYSLFAITTAQRNRVTVLPDFWKVN